MIWDSIIVGGGFYGCYLSAFLQKKGKHTLILEKESDLLTRASYVNQARVHNGYHYPRNYLTAIRSAINFPSFVKDFYPAIDHTFEKIYAISRLNSKVTSDQFLAFCAKIGAPIKELASKDKIVFDSTLIERAFLVKEFAFDAAIVREILKKKINELNVEVNLNSDVVSVGKSGCGIIVMTKGASFEAKKVYICAYSGINTLLHNSNLPILPMKHEITEMALIDVTPELKHKAITVMDGPFFSVMPFPDKGLHTLSHVRYTPHINWTDRDGEVVDPYIRLNAYMKQSNYQYMIHDASRYIPTLKKSKYVNSLFEIKTVLSKNEQNDGRPILLQKDYGFEGLSIIMGGKIDNIYDITRAMGDLSEVGV